MSKQNEIFIDRFIGIMQSSRDDHFKMDDLEELQQDIEEVKQLAELDFEDEEDCAGGACKL